MDAHKRYDMDTVVHTMSGENRDSLDGEDIPAYRLKQTARAQIQQRNDVGETIQEAENREKDIANAKKQQEEAQQADIVKASPKMDENWPSANNGISYNQNMSYNQQMLYRALNGEIADTKKSLMQKIFNEE